MKILRTQSDLTQFHAEHADKRIGFVPTMGNLHDGHISLVRQAQRHSDVVIVSTYVNPTQFGEGEDFDAYPRTFDTDSEKCEQADVSAMFVPTASVIYPHGVEVAPVIDMPSLMRTLCAVSRPTHFQGMATVVLKLFRLVQPDVAVFGEKDYQQLAIIRRLVSEFFLDIDIIGAPIVRESDGLAMSSRNQYLTDIGRQNAGKINVILAELRKDLLAGQSATNALSSARQKFVEIEAKVDYLELIDRDTLAPVNVPENAIIVTAVNIGKSRLLDNLIV